MEGRYHEKITMEGGYEGDDVFPTLSFSFRPPSLPWLGLVLCQYNNVKASGLHNSISLPATGTVFDYYVHFFPLGQGQGGVRPYEWRSWTMGIPMFE